MPYIKDFSKEYISKEKIKPKKKLLSSKEEYKLKKNISDYVKSFS